MKYAPLAVAIFEGESAKVGGIIFEKKNKGAGGSAFLTEIRDRRGILRCALRPAYFNARERV